MGSLLLKIQKSENDVTLEKVATMRLLFLLFVFSFSTLISKGQNVYKTPSGQKYHLGSCRMVKNVSEEITISQAKEMGLEPCKICNPPAFISAGQQKNQAQGQGTGVQCRGLTKAGNRCKHFTRIANGYCFQHQPK